MKYTILLITLLVGCTSMVPYAEIGAGWQIDKDSDWYSRTTRTWQCSNPFVYFETGFELPKNWSVAINHQSHVQCGGPFNSRPEMYTLDARVAKRWGGR